MAFVVFTVCVFLPLFFAQYPALYIHAFHRSANDVFR